MKNYSVKDLLDITNPCVLFPNDLDEAKELYKRLAFVTHPDKNHDKLSGQAFAHIKNLYDEAILLIEKGTWKIPGVLEFIDDYKRKYKINYKKTHPFELGQMYINNSLIAYHVDAKYKQLFINAINRITLFEYKSDRMKEEMSRYLPVIKFNTKLSDGSYLLILQKTPDVLLLKDVLDYYNRTSYPEFWDRHVAWMQSKLYNIMCYMHLYGIVHNSISEETVFVSPEFHSICLFGGWWYAVKENTKMISVPAKLYNLIPPAVKASKMASYTTDMELSKALSRECLKKVTAPVAFTNWLKFSSGEIPAKEFKIWQEKVLIDSYGKRKFIELKLTGDMIYE
jgi:hypothetical protein